MAFHIAATSLTGTGTKTSAASQIANASFPPSGSSDTRITEASDTRILENGTDIRVTEEGTQGTAISSIVATPTKILFDGELHLNVLGTWKEAVPYVKWEGSWVQPESIYKHTGGEWKRVY